MVISTVRPWDNPKERIIPAIPNWSSVYRTSFVYMTDIMTSENGKEQRRAVRAEPRQFVDFQSAWGGQEKADMVDFMTAWQPFAMLLADHIDATNVVGGMGAGAVTIQVQVAKEWMVPGAEIIIRDGRRMETRTISVVNGTTLSFSDSSPEAWPPSSRIHRVIRGRLASNSGQSKHLTTNAATMGISFEVGIGGALFVPKALSTLDLVGWRELWKVPPNWGSALDNTYEYLREDVDYGYGLLGSYVPYNYSSLNLRANYLSRSAEEAYRAASFFARHRGRQKEFLFCTDSNDIPYNIVVGGTNLISVRGQKFGRDYINSTTHRRIILRMIDGTKVHRLIESIVYSDEHDTSTIVVTERLPFGDFSDKTMFGISWGLAARQASDRLDIDWITDRTAQYSMTFRTLENDE